MDLFQWVALTLRPRTVTSDQAIYDWMESQSGRSLPVIYQPFDAGRAGHWHDRGAILDFLEVAGEGDLLDFGPGDGWPSLPLTPFVRSVTGVDGSRRRVEVCSANASRLGITNFRSVFYQPGERLPFPDASFDAVVASSSLEQTPNPAAVLLELHRVLRPGGRLRMWYESLEGYRRGQERELWAFAPDAESTQFVLVDRLPDEERAVYLVLRFAAPMGAVAERLGLPGSRITLADLSIAGLEGLRPWLADVTTYGLSHPRCERWQAMLLEAGFRSAVPTHGGSGFARRLFETIDPTERPDSLEGVDRLLRPLVRLVVTMEAPPHLSPPITAVK
ncbi:MAG: class I SAM-dependent methyltransferase [Bacillota bacterium]